MGSICIQTVIVNVSGAEINYKEDNENTYDYLDIYSSKEGWTIRHDVFGTCTCTRVPSSGTCTRTWVLEYLVLCLVLMTAFIVKCLCTNYIMSILYYVNVHSCTMIFCYMESISLAGLIIGDYINLKQSVLNALYLM